MCCKMNASDFFGFGYGSPLRSSCQQAFAKEQGSLYDHNIHLVSVRFDSLLPVLVLLVAEHKLFSISFAVLSDTSLHSQGSISHLLGLFGI